MSEEVVKAESEPGLSYYPPWREGLKKFLAAKFPPGSVIPRAWFYEAFGMKMPTKEMPHGEARKIELEFMSQFNVMKDDLLREHQIDLDTERGLGFRYMPPGMQCEKAYRDCQHSIRKARRNGIKRIVNVQMAMLTEAEKAKQSELLAKISMVTEMEKRKRIAPAPSAISE